MARYSNPFIQYLSATATVLDGNKLNFYEPGTTTPKDTFSDAALTSANANPVVADIAGRVPDVFLDGIYTVGLTDKDDVTIATADNVGGTSSGQFSDWANDTTYAIPDIVIGSDNNFYRSLTNGNQGNDPISSAAQWEQIDFQRIYNSNVTYARGDRAIGSGGQLYRSITSSNTGNDPTTSTANWGVVTPIGTYIEGLIPSNAADADHDITISTGSASDSTNVKRLVLSTAITKKLDVIWGAGDDAGGLFTGAAAGDTTYHYFIIEKDSDGGIDAGYDTSVIAANIPTGYTAFRRVFSFETNASVNVRGFDTTGMAGGAIRTMFDSPINSLNTVAPGTVAVTLALTLPSGLVLTALIKHVISDTATVRSRVNELSADDEALTNINMTNVADGDTRISITNLDVVTNTSAEIRYRSSIGVGLITYLIALNGWIDQRL